MVSLEPELILDIVIFVAVFPILGAISSFFWIYKQLIILLAKFRGYGLIPIYGVDAVMSLETFAKPGIGERMDSKLKQNVGLFLRLPRNQNVSIHWIRQKFESHFLQMDKSGKPVHPNLFSYFVQFGGYPFRKLVSSIDVGHHIQEAVVPPHQSLQSYLAELIVSPYEPNTPFWKLLVFSSPDVDNEMIVVLKIHHGLADGYTLIHILDTLTNSTTPYIVKDFEETIWDKVIYSIFNI